MTLSLDSSGDLLHRRGYRQHVSRAPLRETLAAAALLSSGWDPSTPLLDPMCGSGTFLIEGAMLAAGRFPGAMRRFSLDHWSSEWSGAAKEARASSLSGTGGANGDIVGVDRDASAIRAAEKNIENAGVQVTVVHAEADDTDSTPGPPGVIIQSALRKTRCRSAICASDSAQDRFPEWRMGIVSPQSPGPDFSSQWMANNGGIRVKFWLRE